MNDSGNQTNVKEHLLKIAKEKIKRLHESSTLVKATVEKYRSLRKSEYNTSPLDVIRL